MKYFTLSILFALSISDAFSFEINDSFIKGSSLSHAKSINDYNQFQPIPIKNTEGFCITDDYNIAISNYTFTSRTYKLFYLIKTGDNHGKLATDSISPGFNKRKIESIIHASPPCQGDVNSGGHTIIDKIDGYEHLGELINHFEIESLYIDKVNDKIISSSEAIGKKTINAFFDFFNNTSKVSCIVGNAVSITDKECEKAVVIKKRWYEKVE